MAGAAAQRSSSPARQFNPSLRVSRPTNGRVQPWSYGNANRYTDTSERLRSAMSRNPHLRVFVANGYYDLATPYFATEYTFSHMGLAPDLRENVRMAEFEAGHMMYIHEPSAVKLDAELRAFYADVLDG